MTAYVGGLRDRLIHDSLFNLVKSGLEVTGWMPGGVNAPLDYPVNVVSGQMDWTQEIPWNTVSVAAYDTTDIPWEVGSDLRQNRLLYYIDVYGSNEAIGLQLSGDVRDIIRGKFSALSSFATPEVLWVWDYTLATPTQIFYCEVDTVRRDRPVTTRVHWMNYFWSLEVQLLDWYDNDQDSGLPYGYDSL